MKAVTLTSTGTLTPGNKAEFLYKIKRTTSEFDVDKALVLVTARLISRTAGGKIEFKSFAVRTIVVGL